MIKFLKPDRPACRVAPITPAAGPEKSADTGLLLMPAAGCRPPFDCMRLNRPRNWRWARNPSEALEITVDDGPHVSRDNGRRGALVLAELAGDIGRRRDQDARQLLVENLGDALLVRWIGIGVDEAHGDGLECPFSEGGRQVLGDGVLVQGHGNGAVGEHALADLEAVASVHQRGWLLVGQVEHALAIVALQE